MDLMLYGAVPFAFPDDTIAGRRARRTGGRADLSLEQVTRLVASEAAEAIQFMLGPRHRERSNSASSPTYPNPELKSYRCPPNSPTDKFNFDFAATDADAEESESATDDEVDGQKADSRNEDSRKRRRVVSFSGSAPAARRVPHKKPTDDRAGRKILSRKKPDRPASDQTDSRTVLPRLNFFAEVQKAAGNVTEDEVSEQKWRDLGKSLRAIADRFGGLAPAPMGRRRQKELTVDSLPNGLWSAVISYVFWKMVRGLK
jgi:hypothetical protein